ncbi:MAG TPA: amidohydrolase [Acidobacteriaceae bacterium]|nr:amidohydrolase [Acidobacteriaceae bacterium]
MTLLFCGDHRVRLATLLAVRFSSLFLIPICLSFAVRAQQPAAPAEIIYQHGDILTGAGLDTASPERAQSLAIRNGLIIETGTDTAISKLSGPKTRIVDLHGAFVMPGFNDAHAHLGEGGEEQLHVNLLGTRSLDEMLERIHTAAQSAPKGGWLQGGGWDHTLWANQTLPTRNDLDRVTAGHPAMFSRVDGHISVANSAALAAANITKNTPDPAGGKIDHDAKGEPTGILRESPVESLVYAMIPPPSPQVRRHAVELATSQAVCSGLTSVQDNSDWEDFLAMEQLEREGALPVRISEWLPFDDSVAMLTKKREHHPAGDAMLHTGMLKGFMDGSLGSRTAALKAPYSDDPTNAGLPRYPQQKLNEMAIERANAGFQIGFHAIGDRAVNMALNAFSAALCHDNTCEPNRRFRVEHSQVVSLDDFDRYKKIGVIASMQPNHLLTDMHWAAARLGPERKKGSYAWKSFLDHGVVVAFGTDYPVEPIAPFRGLYSAVTRKDEARVTEYEPQEKITIQQAIYAYTQGSAFAEFAENKKGRLAPGYYADFVVLDRDITRIEPPSILKTKVLRTVVAGETQCENGARPRQVLSPEPQRP